MPIHHPFVPGRLGDIPEQDMKRSMAETDLHPQQ
jgi:hypothetical protein